MVQSGANLAEVAQLLGHRGVQNDWPLCHVGNARTSHLVDCIMGALE